MCTEILQNLILFFLGRKLLKYDKARAHFFSKGVYENLVCATCEFSQLTENRTLLCMINIDQPLSHHCSQKVSITECQDPSLPPRDIFFPEIKPRNCSTKTFPQEESVFMAKQQFK